MDGRAIFYILTRTGPRRYAIRHRFGMRVVHFRSSFDPSESEHSTHEMFTSTRGEPRWPMPRLPNNPDRDFSAGQSEDYINANVAELFASRPLEVTELFADPIVQMRIGRLITEAMSKRTRRQLADKSR